MDENKLLERIRASAQDVQVPDCLKPEEIIKKMNAAEQCGGGTGNKRRSVWKKSLASAAAVAAAAVQGEICDPRGFWKEAEA